MPEGSSTSLAQILDAEIMRVGTWNGNRFTSKDLEDIAAAAPDVGYVPPLKVGHDESVGARAWGWIRNLRVAGETLVGDLMDIPESLADIIRERGYDQLSAEVYLDLERNGKKFRRALKAVALLGGEIPAVSGLRPLRELFAGDEAKAICFTNQHEGGLAMPDKTTEDQGQSQAPQQAAHRPPANDQAAELAGLKQRSEAQAAQLLAMREQAEAQSEAQAAELAALKQRSEAQAEELAKQKEETLALQAKNREITLTAKLDAWKGPPTFRPFLEALFRTASESPRTLKFSLEPGKVEDVSLEGVVDKLAEKLAGDTSWMLKQLSVVGGRDHFEDPGAEVDARARKLISGKPDLEYSQAVTQVLNADPGLKQAYAGV